MINGQLGQWIDEAQQHWQAALATITALRNIIPLSEWLRMAIVAAVTTIGTTYVITVRLDERQNAIKELMHHLAVDHAKFDNQITTINSRVGSYEAGLSRVEVRQIDVIKRLDRIEDRRR